MLEERLRQTFATQAALVRAVDDPAGRAIARARVLRRRRTAGSGVAVVALLTLSLGTAVTLRSQWQPEGGYRSSAGPLVLPGSPDATAPAASATDPAPAAPAALDLDLWVGDELWAGSGKRLTLTGVGRVTRVHRVAVGWVYGGAEHLRLLRPDGTSVRLASPGPHWLVSPDGTRLAYARGRQLVIHPLGQRGLGAGTAVSVPDGGRPVAFAGEQVVVAVGESGSFGSVDPAGGYRPAKAVTAVYGAVGAGVVGLVRVGDAVCLALVVPGRKGMTAGRTGDCRPAGDADRPGLLAPGGGWLAERRAGGTVLLDLGRALGDGRPVGGDPAGAGGAAPELVEPELVDPDAATPRVVEPDAATPRVVEPDTATPRVVEPGVAAVRCPLAEPTDSVWADARTLVLTDGRRAVRCGTDGSVQPVALPGGLPARWAFVPGEPARW